MGTILLGLLHQIWTDPLRKYPGPLIARLSRIPYMWHTVRGDTIFWIKQLHEQYGEVVRVAPDELSYTTRDAWAEIYGHTTGDRRTTQKDPRFYSTFGNAQDILNADEETHPRFRRNFSHGFSDRLLKEQEPTIRRYADLLVQNLRQTSGRPVDLLELFNFTTFDIMGDLTFGEPLGLLEGSPEYIPWIKVVFATVKSVVLFRLGRYFPLLMPVVTHFLIPKSLQREQMQNFQNCIERVDRRLAKKDARPDIWGLILKREVDSKDKGRARLTVEEMYTNSQIFMIAGTETTATLLAGLTYYLLTNPDKLAILRNEISTAFPAGDGEMTISRLAALPYLNACIEEGLRVYPPVPVGLPRLVPAEGKMINGELVPGKTAVSVAQWATYRNPQYFKNPDQFVPERWTGSEEYASDHRKALQPFSFGPRNCLGRNLAYHEMRLILAKVVRNLELSLCLESAGWSEQKVFNVWEKRPLLVSAMAR
ncbi:cytochrome P450 [Aspergillus recurvatus]